MQNLNIFTSGWNFSKDETNLKGKFEMMNLAIILSSFGLVYGIVINIVREIQILIPIEIIMLLINFSLFLVLRYRKTSLNIVSTIETAQFTFLFVYLIYTSDVYRMDHIWLFTYPIILLYFQDTQNVKYWVILMVVMIMIAPLQPYINVSYTLFQASYLSVVFVIISIIIFFYQKTMDEAKSLILEQQNQLQVQVDELLSKDKLLSVQSKQAVMGEMISMIAHQWRQPLSTVTLSVSDIQLKKMLGTDIPEKEMTEALQEISDTVVYLSETIDDFQTYFNPNKEAINVEVDDIMNKVLNFIHARIKGTHIELVYKNNYKGIIETYQNELIQVILNIMNNAVDAHLEIEKESPKITINFKEMLDYLELTIVDNAGGIQEENINKIFEPYYSTKGKNGTGLGLYMSQMIIQKQFNTNIEVLSSIQGSAFTIKIPKKLS